MEHFGLLPDLLRSVDKLPGLPGARRARAVVEHTRKPGGLPRPERRGRLRAGTPALPGASGAVWSVNGRDATPIHLSAHFGCLFYGAIPGLLPPCPLQAVDKLPGSPGARRARAVVEHTRKPGGLPRPERRGHLRACTPALPGASGAVRSANGRVATPHPPPETESENNMVRFLLCIDFQYPRALRHCKGLR